MTTTSIAGTYFTSWESDIGNQIYQLGPIVVIGADNSIVVDGVTIQGAMVTSNMVSWSSAANNPSSAMLTFVMDPQTNAMGFSGSYWTTADSAPSASNIWGFATQPSAPLSTWYNTYNCYESTDGGSEDPLGTLIISSSGVVFAGKTISNPIYTGLNATGTDGTTTDTCELAWYTSDGNDNNVAISLFNSTQSSGVQLFTGNIWPTGENRPEGNPTAVNNFSGTTQVASDAAQENQVAQVDNQAQLSHAQELHAAMLAAGFIFNAAVGYVGAAGAGQQAAQQTAQNQGGNNDNNNGGDGDDGDDGDDGAADDGAADDGEGIGDALVDGMEDLADAIGLAVKPEGGSAPQTPLASKQASGLSAKQLLELKNRS